MSETSLLDDLSYLDESTEQLGFVYVGFWKRGLAFFIDSILFFFINFIASILIGIHDFFFVSTLLSYLYYPIMHSSRYQATIGKRLLQIKVVNDQGGRISFLHALGRYLLLYLSFCFFIGLIMVAFTQKKQGLHDLIAKTYVIEN